MSEKKKPSQIVIKSEKDAVARVKSLKLRKGVSVVHVTSDGLAIYSAKAARRYAKKNDKEVFTINV